MLSRTLTKPCKRQGLDCFQRPCLYPRKNTRLEAQVWNLAAEEKFSIWFEISAREGRK